MPNVANCQAGMFLTYVSPLGRPLLDKRLYLADSWTSVPGCCQTAREPEERRCYRSKTELALELLELGHLRAGRAAADDAYGMSISFREGLATLGMHYVLDVPASFTAWPPKPESTIPRTKAVGPRCKKGWV